MEQPRLEEVVQNVNDRLTRVEQILPTLATKADLAAAIAPLATKAELAAVRIEIEEEGVRTRQHFDAVAERLEGPIRLLAEGQTALGERMDTRFEAVEKKIAGLDRRLMRLEATHR